jgi:hypothetical protein
VGSNALDTFARAWRRHMYGGGEPREIFVPERNFNMPGVHGESAAAALRRPGVPNTGGGPAGESSVCVRTLHAAREGPRGRSNGSSAQRCARSLAT